MVYISEKKLGKVTFNLPLSLKKEVLKLKESSNVSMNSIYQKAIAEYVERQELKKWEDGAKLASKDKEYLATYLESDEIEDEFYEY